MMQRKRLNTGRGYRISYTIQLPRTKKSHHVFIVIAHGLGHDSESPLIRFLEYKFQNAGYGTATFDFAGHGMSGGNIRDRRAKNFVRDIGDVIQKIQKTVPAYQHNIVVVGYSIGALIAVLYGSEHGHHLRGIAAIASNADADKKFQQLELAGKLRHYKKFDIIGKTKVSKDFWKDKKRYNISRAVSLIHCSTIFVCGTDDTTNFPRESRELYRYAKQPKFFKLIPHENHYFKSVVGKRKLHNVISVWLKNLV